MLWTELLQYFDFLVEFLVVSIDFADFVLQLFSFGFLFAIHSLNFLRIVLDDCHFIIELFLESLSLFCYQIIQCSLKQFFKILQMFLDFIYIQILKWCLELLNRCEKVLVIKSLTNHNQHFDDMWQNLFHVLIMCIQLIYQIVISLLCWK